MALVLVQHDISGQIVEIDEIHLAHPVLGPHYKRVRVNANGKVYAWNAKDDPDEDSETEVKSVLRDGVVIDSDASIAESPEPAADAPQEPAADLSPAEPIHTTKSTKAKADH